MAALNDAAIKTALKFNLHACTDITGFGILGHLLEVAQGCDATLAIKYKDLPFYPGALYMYKKGETTGSNKSNRQLVNRHNLDMRASIDKLEEELLYDPQTSGGLLLSLPDSQSTELIAALNDAGVPHAVRIGTTIGGDAGIVVE